MNTRQIIDQAQKLAQTFAGKGLDSARLPVFSFEDWRAIYNQPPEGTALNAFREQARRSWYLKHFLRQAGVEPVSVPVASGPFLEWAQDTGHGLDSGHDLAHAVGEYVNDMATPPSACRHEGFSKEALAALGPQLATITAYGENAEEPEVLTAVVHTKQGEVLDVIKLLAVENTPEIAWQKIEDFLDDHKLERVFHDRQVRRPEFCPDCNELMNQVASSQDIEAAGL